MKPEDLEYMGIIFKIPKDTVKMTVSVEVFDEKDELVTMTMKASPSDIREYRSDFLDYCDDDYDAVYTLTDEARKYLEKGGTVEEPIGVF